MAEKPRLLLIAPYFFPRHYGGAVQIYDGLLRRLPRWDITVLTESGGADPGQFAAFDRAAPAERGYQIRRVPRLVLHFKTSALPGRLIEMFNFFGKRGLRSGGSSPN